MMRYALLVGLAAAGISVGMSMSRTKLEFSFDETHWWGVGAA